MPYARRKPDGETGEAPDPAVLAAARERAAENAKSERERLTKNIADQKTDTEKREERFIALLQAAMEIDLGDCRGLDLKERNALYANCVKFLAVMKNFKDDDDDGSFFDN
jgi:hypothetical protein